MRAGEALSKALLRIATTDGTSAAGLLLEDLKHHAVVIKALRWEKDRGLNLMRGEER